MEPMLPSNEAERLAALKEYHILDTGPAVLRQHHRPGGAYLQGSHCHDFPGGQGPAVVQIESGGYAATNVPRGGLLCACDSPDRTVRRPGRREDRRLADSALVTGEPHIRFYAGIPLINPQGLALGTLCVIDHQPRRLSAAQQKALQALSRQVMALLELRRVSTHLAAALDHVKTLQGLLPICAWCKRIRDDRGYWDQVEAYFHKSTGADFTHGICPECREKTQAEWQLKRSAMETTHPEA